MSGMIIETLVVSPFMTNTYIVGCKATRQAAIIDPGDDAERIILTAARCDLKPVAIFNTHAHIDHVGAVEQLKGYYGIKFHLHPAEKRWLSTLTAQALLFGVRGVKRPVVDEELSDGQKLKVGELTATVIHTPGHSAGGVCFLFGKNLFCGDTLFAGSIGRTDLPGGSYETLIRSIKEKLLPLGDDVVVYPGHGPTTTIGDERLSNPFLR